MRLFVFGLGYSSLRFIERHAGVCSAIAGTVRSDEKTTSLRAMPCDVLLFNPDHADPAIAALVARADAILVSIPPSGSIDAALDAYGPVIANSRAERIVYLSTVGVYGDHGGDWIDETAATLPAAGRRTSRLTAEQAWRAVPGDRTSVLRLAGIYGPGRNALVNLKHGKAHRIVKPSQVFNRIHVDDIAQTIAAALAHSAAGTWNVCDDEPAPPQDVVTFAAGLMGIAPPPEQDFATADMSAMARSFYATNNRISNAALKRDLGIAPSYPTYRDGLAALWQAGEGR